MHCWTWICLFRLILRRFEVVFSLFWCLEWECCSFERIMEVHSNQPTLYCFKYVLSCVTYHCSDCTFRLGTFLFELTILSIVCVSCRSAKGFMHMKIVHHTDGFILGEFSKPYPTISGMIHYYTQHKLNIRGAEHMALLHPVQDQLL